MAARKKTSRRASPNPRAPQIVKALTPAKPARSSQAKDPASGEKASPRNYVAAETAPGFAGAGRLTANEAAEVDAFVDIMRALVAEHEIAREVLSSDAPMAEYHKPAAMKLQRALHMITQGAASRSLHAVHKQLLEQAGPKPSPPRFRNEQRDMTIAIACDVVAEWLAEPAWSAIDERFAAKWSACRDSESLSAARAADPEFSAWLDDLPSKDALGGALAFTRDVRRQVDPDAPEMSEEEWAAELQRAATAKEVEEARSGKDGRRGGTMNAAEEIVAELSGRPATAAARSPKLSAEAVHKARQRGQALLTRHAPEREKPRK